MEMLRTARIPLLAARDPFMHLRPGIVCFLLVITLAAACEAVKAQEPPKTGAGKKEPEVKPPNEKDKDADKLPLTKLKPAKVLPNLCVLKYRVTTSSPECQALVDQGLAYFYSYVW